MTINGGKPHAVGDRGQRYEVTFFNPSTGTRQVLGWSETHEGALCMADGVDAHPSWKQPKVVDRHGAPAKTEHASKYVIEQHAKELARIAALPPGTCPACEGAGEQGGQFCGGFWTCEACGGSGKTPA